MQQCQILEALTAVAILLIETLRTLLRLKAKS
jgi:hypothetical protein